MIDYLSERSKSYIEDIFCHEFQRKPIIIHNYKKTPVLLVGVQSQIHPSLTSYSFTLELRLQLIPYYRDLVNEKFQRVLGETINIPIWDNDRWARNKTIFDPFETATFSNVQIPVDNFFLNIPINAPKVKYEMSFIDYFCKTVIPKLEKEIERPEVTPAFEVLYGKKL